MAIVLTLHGDLLLIALTLHGDLRLRLLTVADAARGILLTRRQFNKIEIKQQRRPGWGGLKAA